MAADGTIKIYTDVDMKGLKAGQRDVEVSMSRIKETVSKTAQHIAAAFSTSGNRMGKETSDTFEKISADASETGDAIAKILGNSEKSMKSKAASIAAIYRQQGLSQQEAFKKAWDSIERESGSGSDNVRKSLKKMSQDSKVAAKEMQGNLTAGIKNAVKSIGKLLAAAFAVTKIVQFGKEAIELGSDLAEVQNVVDSVFTTMSGKVDEFAKNAAKTAGLSETMAKQYVGTFGAMSKSFSFAEAEALEMATSLTQLAGDVASFYNLSQDEAYTKLKSVFTGETESLKELGVVMTQTALDQYAMANGFGKTTSAMTEQEKVALRYKFVMDQLATASGDFLRTSDGWANQVRVMKLQIDSLKATIGQGLINIFTPVIKVINTLLAKLATVANAFKAFTELITGNKSSGSTGGTGTGVPTTGLSDTAEGYNQAAQGAENLAGATRDAADATNEAAEAAKGYLSPIDEINKYTSKTSSPVSSGSGLGNGAGDAAQTAVENVDYGNLAQGETVIEQVDNKFKQLFETIKSSVQPAIDSLKRLWNEGLVKLGEFAWTALGDFYNHFLVPVGKWTLGTGIPRLVDALNNGLTKVNWGVINQGLVRLWDALAPFAVNVGEGLLWFWENVLVPLGTWTMNEAVPRFLDTLSIAIKGVNNVIEALKPLFQWFWDNVLLPVAQWTGGVFMEAWDGINAALKTFSDWCGKYPGTIQTITKIVVGFFSAWKVTEMLAFIQQSGGVINALNRIKNALIGVTLAKAKDQAKTIALTVANAKDFVVGIGNSVVALAKQAAQFAANTAAKIANTVAQGAMTAATVAWNAVCAVATAVTTAFGAAISFLTSPIGMVVVAIAGIIAVGVALYKNWDTISKWASKVWDSVKKIFSDTAKAIASMAKSIWNGITSFFKNTFNNIKSAASTIFNNMKTAVANVWNAMKTNASMAWNGIKSTLTNTWNGLKSTASNIFGGIKSTVSTAWDGLKSTTSNTWNTIKSALSSVWEKMSSKASSTGEKIKSGFVNAFSAISRIIKSPINAVISLINGLVSGVIKGINWVLSGFNKLKISIPSWVPGIGGKSLGFNFGMISTPHIPYLAKGAVIPPNAPFMAMLGDQKHGTNIETPLSTMEDAMMNTLKRAGITGGRQSSGNTYKVEATVGRRTLFEVMIEEAKLQQAATGKNPFSLA